TKKLVEDSKNLPAFSYAPEAQEANPETGQEGGKNVLLGFADGSLRFGQLLFKTELLDPSDVPKNLRGLEEGDLADYNGGVLERLAEGPFRLQKLVWKPDDPEKDIKPAHPAKILLLNHTLSPSKILFYTALTRDKDRYQLSVNSVREETNLITEEVTYVVKSATVRNLPE